MIPREVMYGGYDETSLVKVFVLTRTSLTKLPYERSLFLTAAGSQG